MNKRQVIFVALIDAWRHDKYSKKLSPRIYSLPGKKITGAVCETFCFQTRPAFFAGLYPNTADIAQIYWLDPKDSPFFFFKWLPLNLFLKIFPKKEKGLRFLLRRVVRFIEKMKGNSASGFYASTAEVPLDLLPNFSFSEKKLVFENNSLPGRSLFDLLRENNKKWLYLGYPNEDQHYQVQLESLKTRFNDQTDFVFLNFAETDWRGHKYGPESQEYDDMVTKIDKTIGEAIAFIESTGAEVSGIIFGDHGQVTVEKNVDILSELDSLTAVKGKDYLFFLDSSQARFWFNNEAAHQMVVKRLGKLKGGKFLNQREKGRLHIDFPHNKFSDEIWVADGKSQIFPNFWQWKNPNIGMHGYLPEVFDNWGCFVAFGKMITANRKVNIDLVDIFPSLCHFFGFEIPPSNQGVSIFDK